MLESMAYLLLFTIVKVFIFKDAMFVLQFWVHVNLWEALEAMKCTQVYTLIEEQGQQEFMVTSQVSHQLGIHRNIFK